jgi:hypothetical protein
MEASVKVCPNCSVQERTTGNFCPHCGSSYLRKRTPEAARRAGGLTKRAKIIGGVALAVVVLGGAGAGAALKINHDNDVQALNQKNQALNQKKNKGIDNEAKAGVVTAAEAMETCATDNNGSYSTTFCTKADVLNIEPTLNDLDARLTVTPATTSYTIVVESSRSANVTFTFTRNASGTSSRTCAVSGSVDRGGCSSSGNW